MAVGHKPQVAEDYNRSAASADQDQGAGNPRSRQDTLPVAGSSAAKEVVLILNTLISASNHLT